MYNLEYWKHHEDKLDTLDEADKEIILREIKAEQCRKSERANLDLGSLDNAQKMELLARWYPRAFDSISFFYPLFVQHPDDYPPVVTKAVNSLIQHMCGTDFQMLAFRAVRVHNIA